MIIVLIIMKAGVAKHLSASHTQKCHEMTKQAMTTKNVILGLIFI